MEPGDNEWKIPIQDSRVAHNNGCTRLFLMQWDVVKL